MKTICPYCGNPVPDTQDRCPSCGAPNQAVKRTAQDQPVTIAQLQEWYKARKLPPYEKTRFFIGIDYRQPKAFGIYQDPATGHFIVYKNKANGIRAIRYEGTDEAYAVNELFQRLKEEILQQKAHALSAKQSDGKPSKPRSKVSKLVLILVGLFAFLLSPFLLIMLIGAGVTIYEALYPPAKQGYYQLLTGAYYCSAPENAIDNDPDFFYFDGTEWSLRLANEDVPNTLQSDRTARDYYLGEDWSASMGIPDFQLSEARKAYERELADWRNGYQVASGYYGCQGSTYYHAGSTSYDGWFLWDTDDDDWVSAPYVPEELTHTVTAPDFYTTSVWDPATQVSDFTESSAWSDYQAAASASDSSSDSDYDWNSGDSWDSGSSDWDSDW